jgi:uncharacterized protein (TIGR02246 family)
MTLYEPDAHFVTTSGEILVGHDAIRKALGGLIEAKTQFRSRVVRAVTVGDIAQLYTDFEGTRVYSSGKTVAVHNNAIEVLRRQPDGTWKLIMGDPKWARMRRPSESAGASSCVPTFVCRGAAARGQRRRRLDAGLSGSYSYNRDGSPKTALSARSGQISK